MHATQSDPGLAGRCQVWEVSCHKVGVVDNVGDVVSYVSYFDLFLPAACIHHVYATLSNPGLAGRCKVWEVSCHKVVGCGQCG